MADKTFWDGRWHLVVNGRLGPRCPELVDGADVKWVADGPGGEFRPESQAPTPRPPPPPPPPPPSGTRIYRVVTQRDEFFKSAFNPTALQDLLNELSRDGWRVVSMVATDVGTFFGSFWAKGGGAARQELVVLLEKIAP